MHNESIEYTMNPLNIQWIHRIHNESIEYTMNVHEYVYLLRLPTDLRIANKDVCSFYAHLEKNDALLLDREL